MKRIGVGLLALVLAVSLCACSGNPAVSVSAPSTTTEPTTTTTELTGPTGASAATITTTTKKATIATIATKKTTLATQPTKPNPPMPTIEISAEELAEKVYCKATVEDDFAEHTVIVSLQRSVSATHHLFTLEEFREMFGIEIFKVEAILWTDPSNENALVNWEKYRQIYKLIIPQSGKQAVLDAIKMIEQHPYVNVANPNYIVVSDLDTE